MIKIENVEVVGWEHVIRGMRNPLESWNKMDSGLYCSDQYDGYVSPIKYKIGPNDHDLMMRLAHGGPVHAKYRRMITVYLDITAPLYFWKEFDTYKVGTVANSCSTMHKIHAKEFTLDDFSCEDLISAPANNDDVKGFIESGYAMAYDEDGGYLGIKHEIGKNETIVNLYSPKQVLECFIISTLNTNRAAYNQAVEKLKRTDLTEAEKKHTIAQKKVFWKQMIQLLPTSYNQKRTIMLNYEVLANMYHSRKNHKLDEWHKLCEWIESLPYAEIITRYRPVYEDTLGKDE